MAALQRPGGAGLVRAEYSSGEGTRRVSITEAGSASAQSSRRNRTNPQVREPRACKPEMSGHSARMSLAFCTFFGARCHTHTLPGGNAA